MSLSEPILTVLREFESAFSQPNWQRAQVLLVGTLLARGRRTVTAALRHAGLGEAADFSSYHQVLNRAHWSALALSRRLLQSLIRAFVVLSRGADLRRRRDARAAVGAPHLQARPLP